MSFLFMISIIAPPSEFYSSKGIKNFYLNNSLGNLIEQIGFIKENYNSLKFKINK